MNAPDLPPVIAGDNESLRAEIERLRERLDAATLLLMRCEPTASDEVRAGIAGFFGEGARAGANEPDGTSELSSENGTNNTISAGAP